MMDGQRLACFIMLLLLKITYFHVSAKQNYFLSEQWTLEDMPLLPIIFAKSEYLPDGPCKEDTQKFLYDLLNGSIWAMQMFDSSTKYPEGILYGHTRYLGNFDECYNLQVTLVEENANIREIDGKYCFVNIEYKDKHAIRQKLPFNINAISVSKYQNETNHSFWNVVEQLEDFVHVRRSRLQLALCVPATCNTENVEIALKIPLEKLGANKNIELRTTVQSCQTAKEASKYTVGAGIYCALLLVLLSLVIISTWYDSTSSKDSNHTSTMGNIMLHFSARKNYAKILHVNYTHTGLDFIHFIRLVNTTLAVYLHNLMFYSYNPTINAVDIEKIFQIPLITIIANAVTVINIFLVLSGVLHATKLLKYLDRYKQLNFFKNVVSRYLRLTPIYAIIIGIYIWILPQLGSGPYWYHIVEECTYCAKNWWMNLLYVNNYLAPSELCAVHGWYLATDFQLFICSQFVIYAFWRMPRKIGYLFLGILTLISCTVTFLATYIYGAPSLLRYTPYTTNIVKTPELQAYYIKGHMWATGYFVGIIAGAILHDHKRESSTWHLSKFWSHILVVPIPLILYISIQYWAYKFLMLDKTDLLEEAIFAFFLRLITALCLCSTIVLLSIGSQLEFYYNFFTSRWMQPLANLCYGVYMVHMILFVIDMGQARTARTFSIGKTIWNTIPLLIVSFLLSLLVAICIEMPLRSLTKWLFFESSKTVVKENNTMVVNDRLSNDKIMKKE